MLIVFLLLSLLAACSSEPTEPTLSDLQPGVWNEIIPGGDTVCSDGSGYSYYVYPGSVNRVVIDFQGGGACWNDITCTARKPYAPTVETGAIDAGQGIYNREGEDGERNPFRDWYHVFVPYCTADIHWGDNVAVYTAPDSSEQTVNHRGAVNARAVLEWVFNNFSAPEKAFVTGCSAGAYGSIMWTPQIAREYPDTDIYQMGDSGAGIVTERFAENIRARWMIEGAFPEFISALDPNQNDVLQVGFLENIYAEVGNHFPESRLSQYNTILDGIQIYFYGLMKGVVPPTLELAQEWATAMLSSMQRIDAQNSADNFHTYLSDLDLNSNPSDGTAHCIISRPQFYTEEVNGIALVDWLNRMINDEPMMTVGPPSAD